MARSLRIELEGGWFHVTARGQNRERIFRDIGDAINFSGRLAELPERFGVEVHAYVMMPNHYHLLLHTPRGGLSRAVQWLNTGYSIWWNRHHGNVGHVFQGRFKSVLDEEGDRLRDLSLYLHFNPVAVEALGLSKGRRRAAALGLDGADEATLEKRLQTLRMWRWSSYRAMAGYEATPDWLSTAELQHRAGGQAEDYRALAESRLGALGGAVWADLHRGIVLGSPAFAERMAADRAWHRENTRAPSQPSPVTWSEIVRWVEVKRGQSWPELCRGSREWGRTLAWWAARRWAGMSLRGLGEAAGGVDYTVVAKALERFSATVDRIPEAQVAMEELTQWVRARLPEPILNPPGDLRAEPS